MSFGMITIERYLVICRGLEIHKVKTYFAIAVAYAYTTAVSLAVALSPDHVDIAGGLLCSQNYFLNNP